MELRREVGREGGARREQEKPGSAWLLGKQPPAPCTNAQLSTLCFLLAFLSILVSTARSSGWVQDGSFNELAQD